MLLNHINTLLIVTVIDPCMSSPCDINAQCLREGPLSTLFSCTCISPYEGNGFNCSGK